MKGFGKHLMIECYKCDKKKLEDSNTIYKLLDELPKKINMIALTKPYVVSYNGTPGGWDKGGFSGFVMINTSHISIHTFPAQKFFSADLYSCAEFDEIKAAKLIAKAFNAKETEMQVAFRGMKFKK